jgi:hypothetical protein
MESRPKLTWVRAGGLEHEVVLVVSGRKWQKLPAIPLSILDAPAYGGLQKCWVHLYIFSLKILELFAPLGGIAIKTVSS